MKLTKNQKSIGIIIILIVVVGLAFNLFGANSFSVIDFRIEGESCDDETKFCDVDLHCVERSGGGSRCVSIFDFPCTHDSQCFGDYECLFSRCQMEFNLPICLDLVQICTKPLVGSGIGCVVGTNNIINCPREWDAEENMWLGGCTFGTIPGECANTTTIVPTPNCSEGYEFCCNDAEDCGSGVSRINGDVYKCEDGEWTLEEICAVDKDCIEQNVLNSFCEFDMFFCLRNGYPFDCFWTDNPNICVGEAFESQEECEENIGFCCCQGEFCPQMGNYTFRTGSCQTNEKGLQFNGLTKENCEDRNKVCPPIVLIGVHPPIINSPITIPDIFCHIKLLFEGIFSFFITLKYILIVIISLVLFFAIFDLLEKIKSLKNNNTLRIVVSLLITGLLAYLLFIFIGSFLFWVILILGIAFLILKKIIKGFI